MNNKIPLALTLCSTMIALPLQANEGHQWRAIAFGQSTDSNFPRMFCRKKIGVNDVTIAGKKLTPQDVADLSQPITIESRGGKIANSHDGLTLSLHPATDQPEFYPAGYGDRQSVWPGKWRASCGTGRCGTAGPRCNRVPRNSR